MKSTIRAASRPIVLAAIRDGEWRLHVRSKLDACGILTFIDDARDFMSGNTGILNSWPSAFFREHVTVADTAGLHFDEHLSRTRLRNFVLDDLEIASRLADLYCLHWC